MDPMRKASSSTNRSPSLLYGTGCFVITVVGLFLLGSESQSTRFAGLILISSSGVMAWLGERARYRSVNPQGSTKNRGYYLVIAFSLVGLLVFLISPYYSVAAVRSILVLLGRALAHH
jgi:hypothetical protein